MKDCQKKNQIKLEESRFLDNLVKDICATYEDETGINHIEGFNLPKQSEIRLMIDNLLEIIFPGFSGSKNYSLKTIHYNVGDILSRLYAELSDQIYRSYRFNCHMNNCDNCDVPQLTEDAVQTLLAAVPNIRESMKLDVAAAFEGDPAAKSYDEIILSYPGIKTITIQRLAHVLYHKDVPLLPRMMTEFAHSETGIDIHPGAHLDRAVFIDHGTGVVIGETAKIGSNVKIYQGVTLGALSFPKDACGMIIKGAKRHPTIEDNVTIYSGATILGDIVIGKNTIIGGNVWLTESTTPGTKVTISPPKNTIKTKGAKHD